MPKRCQRRVIPAGAGNAATATAAAPQAAGHPRGGGERGGSDAAPRPSAGSSPRGRGTHTAAAWGVVRNRVIPAGAGNAWAAADRGSRAAGHPRGGGERTVLSSGSGIGAGSSPRGRGTPEPPRQDFSLFRVIPAGAGNARQQVARHSVDPGHPRGGGERQPGNALIVASPGSSPRGRGTLPATAQCRRSRRVIPAGAGNAKSSLTVSPCFTGHPRGGGERSRCARAEVLVCGSSPRGRGTLCVIGSIGADRRVIPAGAGNAPSTRRAAASSTGHPRGGGERYTQSPSSASRSGSSPRGRGTPIIAGAG